MLGISPHAILRSFVLGGVIAALTACGSDSNDSPSESNGRFISAPEGELFSDPTWLASLKAIVVGSQPAHVSVETGGSLRGSVHLALVNPDEGTQKRLKLPNEQGCSATEQLFPQALRDGRLAFIQDCVSEKSRSESSRSLLAWDPRTGIVEPLVPYRLANATYRFSFSADLKHGVILEGGSGRASYLSRFGATRLHPIEIPVSEVNSGAMSPRGDAIAVVAVTSRDNPDRPMTLYLTSYDGSIRSALVRGAREIRPPAWSPDGREIAFAMTQADGKSGVWVVNVSTGDLRIVRQGDRYDTVAWLPDGTALIATVGQLEPTDGEDQSGVEFIDS
jgi:hypothetical protein